MKSSMITPLLGAAVLMFPAGVRADPALAAAKLYGEAVCFDVFRKGDKVGHHRTAFVVDKDTVHVETKMRLTVTLLSIPVYNFSYKAKETWQAGALQQLDVVVDDDGDKKEIKAKRQGEILTVTGPEGQ